MASGHRPARPEPVRDVTSSPRPKPSPKLLDAMIEEATVDAYNDEEQITGLFTMLEEHLALPFQTTVLGVTATVTKIDLTAGNEIVAICRRDAHKQAIPILDLPLPTPGARRRRMDRRLPPLALLRAITTSQRSQLSEVAEPKIQHPRPESRPTSDNARLEINAVALADDPEDRPRVLTNRRVEAGDLLAAGLPPVIHGRGLTAVDGDRLALDPPREARCLDRLGDRPGGCSSTAPRPCHGVSRTENIESLLVIPAGMSHFPSRRGPARCGAGRGEGRTPGWRAKLAPPAGSRTAALPQR